jgi:hypothetical protein
VGGSSLANKVMRIMNPMRNCTWEDTNSYYFPSNQHAYIDLDFVKSNLHFPFLGDAHITNLANLCGLTKGNQTKLQINRPKRMYEMVNTGSQVLYVKRFRLVAKDNLASENLFAHLAYLTAAAQLNVVPVGGASTKLFQPSNVANIAFDYLASGDLGNNFQNTTVFDSAWVKKLISESFRLISYPTMVMQPNAHMTWGKMKPVYIFKHKVMDTSTQQTVYRGATSWDFITTWGENGTVRSGAAEIPTGTVPESPVSFSVNIKDTASMCTILATTQYDAYNSPTVQNFQTVVGAAGAVPQVTAAASTITQGQLAYMTGASAQTPIAIK